MPTKKPTPKLPDTITWSMSTNLANMGIEGLMTALDHNTTSRLPFSGNYQLSDNNTKITVPYSQVKDLGRIFFKYIVDTYGPYSFYDVNLLPFNNQLEDWQNNKFQDFSQEDFNDLIKFYKHPFATLSSNSFVNTGYPDLLSRNLTKINPTITIKNLKENYFKKLSKGNYYKNHYDSLMKVIPKLTAELIAFLDFLSQPEIRYVLLSHYLTYMIPSNAFTSLTFTSNTKVKQCVNFEKNYNINLIDNPNNDKQKDTLAYYLTHPAKSSNYRCANCDAIISKSSAHRLTILGDLGYDDSKKPSNNWTDIPTDNFLCPKCTLLYTFIAIGMTYNYNHQGIFINNNFNLKTLHETNNKLRITMHKEIKDATRANPHISMHYLLSSIFEQSKQDLQKYNMDSVEIITHQNNASEGHYNSQIITTLDSKIITNLKNTIITNHKSGESTNRLDALQHQSLPNFKGETQYYLYDHVIDHILHHQSIDDILLTTLKFKAAQADNLYVTSFTISNLIYINLVIKNYLRGDFMSNQEKQQLLNTASDYGNQLHRVFQAASNAKKANQLAYQLLRDIKNNNVNRFITTLIKVYASNNQRLPQILIDHMANTELFKDIATAYTAGLIQTRTD